MPIAPGSTARPGPDDHADGFRGRYGRIGPRRACAYPKTSAVYIRPMYWALDGGDLGVVPKPDSTGFAICLEEIPMAPAKAASR